MENKWYFKNYSSLINTYPLWQDWWYVFINTSIYTWSNNSRKWVLSNTNSFNNIQNQINNITNLINIDSDITLNTTNHKIVCNATDNNIIITLPTAVWIQWKQYIITRIDDSWNTVTIQPQSWETIFWANSEVLYQYETLDFTSDNTNYN